MNSKIFNYKKIGNITNIPLNNLWNIETSDGDIYFIDSEDQTLLKKIAFGGTTVTEISNEDEEIVGMWYDRANEIIYYGVIDSGGFPHEFQTYSLTLSTDTRALDHTFSMAGGWNAYNITEILDIFIYLNTIYEMVVEDDGLNYDLTMVDNVGASTWTEDMGSHDGQTTTYRITPITIVGGYAWFLWWWDDENAELWKWEIGTGNFTEMEDCGAGTSIPSNKNLRALSYDGSDVLYFVLVVSNTNYLYSYSIGTDTLTQLGEFNVSLMLDRNTNTDYYESDETTYRAECFRLEKGFDINDPKIYQIPRSYQGNLNYIANWLRTLPNATIVAITDSYVILNNDGTYELWEFVDLGPDGETIVTDININHPEREYPVGHFLWRKKTGYSDPPTKDQLVQVYGRYTSTNGVADIVSDESLYLSYRGAHNFSGITTTANYFKGSGGLNYETVGTSGTSIAWVDSATLYDGACEIVESWQSHNNVLRLQDDATAGEDPNIVHNITQATSGVFEFWVGSNDVSEDGFRIRLLEDATSVIDFHLRVSNFYYYNGAFQLIQAGLSDDTLYHIKIQWYADNTFDIWVDGTQQIDGAAVWNNQVSGINAIDITCRGDTTDYLYLDAPGLVGETDPQSYVYEESWNTLDGDIDELLDEGYTIDGALGGSYIRVGDVGSHEDVLILYDNQGDIDYADYVQLYISFSTNQTYGTIEFFMRTTDATYDNAIHLYNGNTQIFVFKIDEDKFQYYDGGWNDVGLGASDNTWYHIRIAFECTSGTYESLAQYDWKVWINGVEYGDYNFASNEAQATKIRIRTTADNSNYYFYIDAVDFSWSTNYRRNRNAALSLDDQIIFEGLTKSHDKNIETEIECLSKAKELDNIHPKVSSYTNYTGKTSGQIVDQLIDDFCNYILPGTISNGSNTFTCPDDLEFKGDKSLRTIINELADGEQFTWGLIPTGELDFDDGTVNSYVSLDSNDNNKLNPHVEVLSEDYNQVIIYGGHVDGSKVGPYTYDNTASQQLHGIITWTKTYANQFDATILQTLANNKGAIQGAAPLIYETELDMDDNNEYGFIQPHETIYLSEGLIVSLGSDETLTEDEAGNYILAVNEYDGIMQDSRLKMTDGLLFIESAQTTLSQQNSQLIEQLGNETQMVAYSDASVSQGDHNAEGIKSTFTAGENVTFGDFCYFKSDGKMWKSDADASSTMPIVAMAMETITADNTGKFLLIGIARDDTWNWATIGGRLYASCTTGEVSQSAPVGSGDQVQLVGWAITADIIYFKPDFELTTIP